MWPPTESGSWAEWVSGIATVLALGFALIQLAFNRGENRRMLASEREKVERLQASGLTAWTVPGRRTKLPRPTDVFPEFGKHAVEYRTQGDQLIVHNGSGELIFNCLIYLIEADPADRHYAEALAGAERKVYRVIPPGTFAVDLGEGVIRGDIQLVVHMEFTDAAGRRWVRDSSGRLSRAPLGRLPELSAYDALPS